MGCCAYGSVHSVSEEGGRGSSSGLRLEGRVCCTLMVGGVKVGVRREFVTCPFRGPGSNSVTVFVTSRSYRQTSSAQAHKEADRFTRSILWIHAH